MALKVELKPHERIIIGNCVITNTDQRARLLIEGERTPILREKDILTATTADTPCKRIYLAVQLMYTSAEPQAHHEVYFSLIRDILNAAPSTWPIIESINNHILKDDLYKALRECRNLIGYERELLDDAQCGQGIRQDRQGNRQSARSGIEPPAQGSRAASGDTGQLEPRARRAGRCSAV
ncbi:MAG: flagellar biosynthesis repressor FlbT [Xanthobacteraceae bacterium]|nr:MAG: flagellar biosynthesis repressor FlbT [Xanthobacteraceae bacterium]